MSAVVALVSVRGWLAGSEGSPPGPCFAVWIRASNTRCRNVLCSALQRKGTRSIFWQSGVDSSDFSYDKVPTACAPLSTRGCCQRDDVMCQRDVSPCNVLLPALLGFAFSETNSLLGLFLDVMIQAYQRGSLMENLVFLASLALSRSLRSIRVELRLLYRHRIVIQTSVCL